jgi:nucleotide-binding universal stress UspA family protein
MTYQRILVALERSEDGEVVLQQAIDLAQKENARLLLFHCMPSEHDINPYTDIYGQQLANFSRAVQDSLHQELELTKEWLADCAEEAETAGVESESDCRFGEPGHAICRYAHHWDADLIVVGRRGRRGFSEMLLGSVSNYVVHHANCSVLVVQKVKAS